MLVLPAPIHGEPALHQHLGDAGGEREVAVDLERRMGVEQVRVDPAARAVARARVVADRPQQVLHQDVGVVAVLEACPEVDLPAERPAGAVVAADLEGALRRGEKLRESRR